jgi:hypothetical protein
MNGQAEAGAPSGAYYDSNGQLVVPVHPPTWEYDMMAQQYHWNSPPPGATH